MSHIIEDTQHFFSLAQQSYWLMPAHTKHRHRQNTPLKETGRQVVQKHVRMFCLATAGQNLPKDAEDR
jgi:hypothetical protein